MAGRQGYPSRGITITQISESLTAQEGLLVTCISSKVARGRARLQREAKTCQPHGWLGTIPTRLNQQRIKSGNRTATSHRLKRAPGKQASLLFICNQSKLAYGPAQQALVVKGAFLPDVVIEPALAASRTASARPDFRGQAPAGQSCFSPHLPHRPSCRIGNRTVGLPVGQHSAANCRVVFNHTKLTGLCNMAQSDLDLWGKRCACAMARLAKIASIFRHKGSDLSQTTCLTCLREVHSCVRCVCCIGLLLELTSRPANGHIAVQPASAACNEDC